MTADIIIIGGGAAGLGAARQARALGASPVLVTDGPIGGDCTFTGCVPSKALIAQSKAGRSFREAMKFVDETVDRISRAENADVLRSEGIEVIEGTATLSGAGSVTIDGRTITAKAVVIATGATAFVPPIPGLSDIDYLTNKNLFALKSLPRRLGIIGGGPIGCEMAFAFARFGAEVTVVEGQARVLPNEEPDASAVVQKSMEASGVKVLTGDAVALVGKGPDGISIDVGGRTVAVDALLVATGRTANTTGLGLADAGVELGSRGEIVVDQRMRTSLKRVSAAGDVTGLLPFTHAADEQARLAVGHALRKGSRWSYDPSSTPWVVFTSPEVARVGVREAHAPDGALVAHLPLELVDRAITEDRTDGFVKLISAPKPITRNMFGGKLVGATIVADRAGEMIHGPTLALRLGMFVGRLAQVTTPYPTWSTAIQQAAGQFFRKVDGLEARPPRR